MQLSINDKKPYLFFGLVILISVLFCGTKLFAYVCLATDACLLMWLFIFRSRLLLKYIPNILGIGGQIIGLAICELCKLSLYEIHRDSAFVGSLPLASVYWWILFLTILIIDPIVDKKLPKEKLTVIINNYNYTNLLFKIFPIFIFIVGIVFWATVFKTPEFTLGVGRDVYAEKYIPGIIYKFSQYPTFCIPIAYMSIFKGNKENLIKKLLILCLTYIPYIGFLFWIGHKFGSFFTIFILILLPTTSFLKNHLCKRDFTIIIVALLVAVIIFGGILVVYFFTQGYSLEGTVYRIYNRISQQGQLWWGIYQERELSWSRISEFKDEFNALVNSLNNKGANHDYGVYRILSIIDEQYKQDFRGSAQGFELAYYYFNIFAILFVPILAALGYIIIISLYINATNNFYFISAFVYARLFNEWSLAFNQGDWYLLFTKGSIFFYVILILAIFIRKKLLHAK